MGMLSTAEMGGTVRLPGAADTSIERAFADDTLRMNVPLVRLAARALRHDLGNLLRQVLALIARVPYFRRTPSTKWQSNGRFS